MHLWNRISGHPFRCTNAYPNYHFIFSKWSTRSQIFTSMSETYNSSIMELLKFYSQSLTMTNTTAKTNNLYIAKMTFYWPWMCFNGTDSISIESGQLHIHKQQFNIWRCHTCRGGNKKLLVWHYFWIIRSIALILFSTTANWIFHIDSMWLARNLETNPFFSKTDSKIWAAIGIKLGTLHSGEIKQMGSSW